ncbi:MAG: tyrosine-type recombinase/integrase [Alphaproteobacteria bacterium]
MSPPRKPATADVDRSAGSGDLVSPDQAELLDRLQQFLEMGDRGALAPRTLAALHSDRRIFSRWCAGAGRSWLPADADTVVAFVVALGNSRRPATVERYLASIATWHAAADLPNPCKTLRVRMARRAHANAEGVRPKQAKPIGAKEVGAILEAMAPVDPAEAPDLRALRDAALLLTARDSLARASELVALRWEDMEAAEDGSGTILIRRSKTDQAGEGRVAWLSAETMTALATWRAAMDVAVDPSTRVAAVPAPLLFRHLARRGYGQALTPTSVARIFKERAASIGLVTRGYSAHSTRVGTAQDLLAAGEDLLAVMNAGGWSSPRMPARYGERLLAARGAVARLRGRKGERQP